MNTFMSFLSNNPVRRVVVNILLPCVILSMLPGCASLLPSSKETIPSPWHSFDDAKAAFDKIVPNKTTIEELKQLGFDPFKMPNIRILTYLDFGTALSSVKEEELDVGIRACIKAMSYCHAYEFEPRAVKSKRYGNFWLDFFNFRRKINESGWSFKAFVIVVDRVVVYKLWGGSPLINEERETRNPLGPVQDASDTIFRRAVDK